MNRFSLNGISIETLEAHELLQRITAMIRGKRMYHIVTVNPEFIVEASRNQAFHALLATADLATADGAGIILAGRLKGASVRLRDRMTGVMLTETLLREAQLKQYPIVILLKENSLVTEERLHAMLQKNYPRLTVTIFREPYDLTAIAAAQPRILFSALGSPAQETWIRTYAKDIPGLNIAIGVGGTFDLLSGTIQRAPRAFRTLGLEWFWRLLQEPKRLPRILRATVVFPIKMMLQR